MTAPLVITAEDTLQGYLLKALSYPVGLVLSCSQPARFPAIFDKTIKNRSEEFPELTLLTFRPSPTTPHEFYIFRKAAISDDV